MNKTARAHTNIALIKYWGKADSKNKLPLMSSLSMTLDQFFTDTRITVSEKNEFVLNGVQQAVKDYQRVFTYLKILQKKFGVSDNLRVESTNHVPTAAGLASSSSAFAAMAGAFCACYNIQLSKRDLSKIARLGSGSASRSIYGGFAIWQKGFDHDSSYAYALDETPTMDLHLLAIELNPNPKKLSSTAGMLQAQTSPFFIPWIKRNEQELSAMVAAIKAQDFSALGQLAELNANEMHAINLTANPGFSYFEPDTIHAIHLVQQLRASGIECYYTIDAGPNVKILTQLKNVKEIVKQFLSEFENVKIVNASFGPGLSYLDQ
ncbi:diphosphomevalonate decarboxylase [Lactobacillus sp. ESL0236]|uniref:diphosphomevalonate decarboxylase n=1 Tax=unclassified Lactobacillus TaxID=2620435 RepID=UPI000EFC1B20|nr:MULTISPECIES: diphosphomevalonate decarboxylase [unclassified Lactobacillus]RMC39965.1 diphosphomevalonate decarboxylase [Lactobacillus sp. ESL0237]RMC44125.1 diphosphomevalonate decarboxylase [Lactobacillus sp. ESL0234]RMC45453.1 diphosphomevalonate decarboxylase [Lactobacillus sp. ESL0236]